MPDLLATTLTLVIAYAGAAIVLTIASRFYPPLRMNWRFPIMITILLVAGAALFVRDQLVRFWQWVRPTPPPAQVPAIPAAAPIPTPPPPAPSIWERARDKAVAFLVFVRDRAPHPSWSWILNPVTFAVIAGVLFMGTVSMVTGFLPVPEPVAKVYETAGRVAETAKDGAVTIWNGAVAIWKERAGSEEPSASSPSPATAPVSVTTQKPPSPEDLSRRIDDLDRRMTNVEGLYTRLIEAVSNLTITVRNLNSTVKSLAQASPVATIPNTSTASQAPAATQPPAPPPATAQPTPVPTPTPTAAVRPTLAPTRTPPSGVLSYGTNSLTVGPNWQFVGIPANAANWGIQDSRKCFQLRSAGITMTVCPGPMATLPPAMKSYWQGIPRVFELRSDEVTQVTVTVY